MRGIDHNQPGDCICAHSHIMHIAIHTNAAHVTIHMQLHIHIPIHIRRAWKPRILPTHTCIHNCTYMIGVLPLSHMWEHLTDTTTSTTTQDCPSLPSCPSASIRTQSNQNRNAFKDAPSNARIAHGSICQRCQLSRLISRIFTNATPRGEHASKSMIHVPSYNSYIAVSIARAYEHIEHVKRLQ